MSIQLVITSSLSCFSQFTSLQQSNTSYPDTGSERKHHLWKGLLGKWTELFVYTKCVLPMLLFAKRPRAFIFLFCHYKHLDLSVRGMLLSWVIILSKPYHGKLLSVCSLKCLKVQFVRWRCSALTSGEEDSFMKVACTWFNPRFCLHVSYTLLCLMLPSVMVCVGCPCYLRIKSNILTIPINCMRCQ